MKKTAILLLILMCGLCAFADKAPVDKKEGYSDSDSKAKIEFINNGKVCVGVDLNAGGAIAFLSSGSEKLEDNWVSIHDLGRYIQQSYYAGNEMDRRDKGQHKLYSPWQWNPIQAGSVGCTFDPPHPNAHSELVEFEKNS